MSFPEGVDFEFEVPEEPGLVKSKAMNAMNLTYALDQPVAFTTSERSKYSVSGMVNFNLELQVDRFGGRSVISVATGETKIESFNCDEG